MIDSFINPRYILYEFLGKGGMGEVHRAYDRLTGKYVALKQVTTEARDLHFNSKHTHSDVRLSLAIEFRTLAGLRHPNIVSVLDYGFDRDRVPYFSMQLVENAKPVTLYGANKPFAEKVSMVVQMLQALTYLHRRGIIHRDLKPANVMVTADGMVKVMDFGLAQQGQVKSQGIAGTVFYMAPELFAEQPASTQSDLYAVGTMAYELFTGKHPFNIHNVATLLHDIISKQPDVSMLPPALGKVLATMLHKSPFQRYPSAADAIEALCKATSQPVPVEDATLRDSFLQAAQFVGRDAELRQLLDALDLIIKPPLPIGSAWLIGGESGVGKSRLLEELRIHALTEGAAVISGQAVAGGGLPYQVWRDPMRWLALATDLNDLEAGVLKEIMPDIDVLLGRDIPDAPALEGNNQQRLILTVTDIFTRRQQPTVLLLEDLQWSEKSLPLLRHLSGLVGQMPLLIIGTYRSEERPDLPALLPEMMPVTLQRLDDSAIAALSQSMLGESGAQPELIDLLKRETEGNAFFMVEVVRALAEDAGGLNMVGLRTLPSTVLAGGITEIVRRRLVRVPEWGQALLKLAAVTGRQLDLNILSYLITGVDALFSVNFSEFPDELPRPDKPLPAGYTLEDWLNACVNAAVLEASGDRWRFSHDKLRDGVLNSIPVEERPALHRRIALAIESLYEPDRFAPILVTHWHHAGDLEYELYYLQLAASQLNNISAYHESRGLLEHGLKIVPPDMEHTELNVLLMLAEALEGLGDSPAAHHTATRALNLARSLDDNTGAATALKISGAAAWRKGDYENARSLLEESLRLMRNPSTISLIADVEWSRGNLETAKSYYLSCLDSENPFSRAEALQGLGTVVWRQGNFEAATRYMWESIAIKQQIGYRRGVAGGYNSLGVIASRQGDYAAAAQHFEQSITIYESIGNRWGVSNVACNLAFVYIESGELDKARAMLHRALTISETLNSLPVTLELLAGYAHLALLDGNSVYAAELVGLVAAHPSTNDFTHNIRLKPLYPSLSGYETAIQRGEGLDLRDIVQALLTSRTV